MSLWFGASLFWGAAACALVVPAIIRLQRREHAGQQIYEDGPKSHVVKAGTPTFGGIAFALAAAGGLAIAFAAPALRPGALAHELPLACLVLGAGAIGFVDDYLIVRARRALGLRARAKFALICVVAAAYVLWIDRSDPAGNVELWFGTSLVMPHIFWFVLSVLAIVGAANAVNLTDGLDGLATGTVLPTLLALQLPLQRGGPGPTSIGLAALGACAVFLWYNRHPAQIFMGDTGSLALGALLAGIAIQTHLVLLLPLFGAVFVFEALSVILQVASFKAFRRRIFRMSPLHHHFELSGWRESAVTASFVSVQVLFAAATWLACWAFPGNKSV
ncbi:MAG: phospho-N-acetylmuramoyl-pentapeptide-transferase [Candidatus Eremiobacteraeota bacterium]|nr:phospho-N-acetylmuramoyl-pentapeptide-transferase [Candidatus Eremiobacteraeota bacterium]